LAGGCNIAGSNIMVGGEGGQEEYLKSYEKLGLPSEFHPSNQGAINKELGLIFHSDSPMLRGIQSVTSPKTRAHIDGCIYPLYANDDVGTNTFNPLYWLNKAGATGSLLQLTGTKTNPSGGHSIAPNYSIDNAFAPVPLNNLSSVEKLFSLKNMAQSKHKSRRDIMLSAWEKMGNLRIDQIDKEEIPTATKNTLKDTYKRAKDRVENFEDPIDFKNDPDINKVFGELDNKNTRIAINSKMIIDGYVGTGTILSHGNDYHDYTRSTGELKDFDNGVQMGQMFEFAALRGKPLLICIFTDGGVGAFLRADESENGRGKFVWGSDNGNQSAAFMLLYNPKGRPKLRHTNRQVGHYTSNQAALRSKWVLTSNSPENMAKAFVANYLALHGEEGRLAQIVGSDPFGNDLEKYLMFDQIT
jgi:hypothetical protein